MANKKLLMTGLRLDVLRFYEEYYLEHKFPPSFDDVMTELEASSVSVVKYAVDRLIQDGFLLPGIPGTSRTIVPTFKKYIDEEA